MTYVQSKNDVKVNTFIYVWNDRYISGFLSILILFTLSGLLLYLNNFVVNLFT